MGIIDVQIQYIAFPLTTDVHSLDDWSSGEFRSHCFVIWSLQIQFVTVVLGTDYGSLVSATYYGPCNVSKAKLFLSNDYQGPTECLNELIISVQF